MEGNDLWQGLGWNEAVDTGGEKHVWKMKGGMDSSEGFGVIFIKGLKVLYFQSYL